MFGVSAMNRIKNRELYKAARAAEKIIYRRKKKQYEESVVAEAKNSLDQNGMWKFFQTVNGVRSKNSAVCCHVQLPL